VFFDTTPWHYAGGACAIRPPESANFRERFCQGRPAGCGSCERYVPSRRNGNGTSRRFSRYHHPGNSDEARGLTHRALHIVCRSSPRGILHRDPVLMVESFLNSRGLSASASCIRNTDRRSGGAPQSTAHRGHTGENTQPARLIESTQYVNKSLHNANRPT